MDEYKKSFIEFIIESGVLTFGNFTTKSGRKTPFFINAGNFNTGRQLNKLGEYYAKAIRDNFGAEFDVLFGPAYKGIPLSVATSIALSNTYGSDVKYCANRKEAKDHGDKGSFLGADLNDGDRILIIEDVTTAGTSIYETMPLLKGAANVDVFGLIIAVDRMEKGKNGKRALKEIEEEFELETCSIVNMDEIVGYLHGRSVNGVIHIDDEMKKRIDDYYNEYGL